MVNKMWIVFNVSGVCEMKIAMMRDEYGEIEMNLTRCIGESENLFQEGVKSQNTNEKRGIDITILMRLRGFWKMTSLKLRFILGTLGKLRPGFGDKRR